MKVIMKLRKNRNRNRRFTKSRTGIEMRSPPKQKSLSNTSSYRHGETFLRAGDHEELCGICNQSFENHSPDFNIDLFYLQNKYGEMLNQVTQFDTVSRPYTPNSMYSMVSKKPNITPPSKNDIEYVKKVEKIKLEHHNMRTKVLKHMYKTDILNASEDRRPSRYHLKCPI